MRDFFFLYYTTRLVKTELVAFGSRVLERLRLATLPKMKPNAECSVNVGNSPVCSATVVKVNAECNMGLIIV